MIAVSKSGVIESHIGNYGNVHEERRRYNESETSRVKQQVEREKPIRSYNWEYKVVRGRWRISKREQDIRRRIGRMSCNKMNLEQVLNAKGKAITETKKFDQEVEEAIEKLKKLQINETMDDKGRSERQEIEASARQHERRNEVKEQRTRKNELRIDGIHVTL